MKNFIFLLSFLSVSALADDLQKVKVHTFDDSVDTSRLGNQYSKEKVSPGSVSHLPAADDIQHLLEKANLLQETEEFDQLAKDLLVHHARKYDSEKLKNKYPSIESKKLLKLKELVTK